MLKAGDLVEIVNVDGIMFAGKYLRNGDIVRLGSDEDGDLTLDSAEEEGYGKGLTLIPSEYMYVRKVGE